MPGLSTFCDQTMSESPALPLTGAPDHPEGAAPHPRILAIPAFQDNYIWMLVDQAGRRAAVVDPGDAAPVIDALQAHHLDLVAVLVTHHHADHVGGLAALRARYPAMTVHGPHNPAIAGIDRRWRAGDSLALDGFGAHFDVFEVPGHTLDHIAWYAPRLTGDDTRPVLFCGDTLFAGGCGRLFEGTPVQMHASLSRLAALPGDTLVYCAHEYTASNLRFARKVEPNSAALARRGAEVAALRAAHRPTVPSSIAVERATNPFLRVNHPDVQHAAQAYSDRPLEDAASILGAVRHWKDSAR